MDVIDRNFIETDRGFKWSSLSYQICSDCEIFITIVVDTVDFELWFKKSEYEKERK